MKTAWASLLFVVCAVSALGDTTYVGSDSACFYSSGSSCALTDGESSIGSNLSGNPLLTYTPDASFSAPAAGGSIELGMFSVTQSLFGYEGGTFDINITFTQPGGGANDFSASTMGLVVFGAGGAEISFDAPLTQVYTYPGGSFEVSLPSAPILVGNGSSVALDAFITPGGDPPAAVPEPASLATAGVPAMLLGLAFWRRRRVTADVIAK